ncbi:N-acetyltransferase family protein [Aquipseudomonas campi]
MSEAFSQRPATADDLHEVVGFVQNADELFFAFPRATWPLTVGQLETARLGRRNATVALLGGQLAGYANFYQWQQGASCALGNLMVAPWARRHGVAHYLIGSMEQQARHDFTATHLQASCFNGNSAGLLLYTRLGYAVNAIVERQHPNGERVALVQFSKALNS